MSQLSVSRENWYLHPNPGGDTEVECWACSATVKESDAICSECKAEQLCPSCGGDSLFKGHLSANDYGHGECDWYECDDCNYKWNIG